MIDPDDKIKLIVCEPALTGNRFFFSPSFFLGTVQFVAGRATSVDSTVKCVPAHYLSQ